MRMRGQRELRKGRKSSLTLVAYQRQPGTEAVSSRLLQGQARILVSHDKLEMSRNCASRLARVHTPKKKKRDGEKRKAKKRKEKLAVQPLGHLFPNFAQ
jgi:hypothetical protein